MIDISIGIIPEIIFMENHASNKLLVHEFLHMYYNQQQT